MMINKRLIGMVKESKRYIALNVVCQWISLISNIALMWTITSFIFGDMSTKSFTTTIIISIICVAIRFISSVISSKMSYLSGKSVKIKLREKIYEKLLRLGSSYKEKLHTSEVIQVAVEGVDQLETYFGSYLPQFFYSMLAPITLFIVLSFVSFKSAIVLLICVPLIPISIAAVQTWAKKLLSKYWTQYTGLGDTFLENLQGLTTLKIYSSDKFKHKQMNSEAESFRKITMKVLTMQLNSITIMDLVAFGGAALGVIMSVTELRNGNIDLAGCLLIILLSADFFIPMRMLGSFFHIAMNGMAASEKIFKILDIEEDSVKKESLTNDYTIKAEGLSFKYEDDRDILKKININIPQNSFTAIVGKSGCGKSTLAQLIMGRNKNYSGSLSIGGIELSDISEESLMKSITYISHQSYLFKGTVRENLLLGNPKATDEELTRALDEVNLLGFINSENGLDTLVNEMGSNFSGGQCQRLALARGLIHNTPVYIFDEATSNIDSESEDDIINQIYKLASTKTVIMISHRLLNSAKADNIYVMENGEIVESGTHNDLLSQDGLYGSLWESQQELEKFVVRGE